MAFKNDLHDASRFFRAWIDGPMVMGALEKLLRGTAWPQLDLLLVDMPPGARARQAGSRAQRWMRHHGSDAPRRHRRRAHQHQPEGAARGRAHRQHAAGDGAHRRAPRRGSVSPGAAEALRKRTRPRRVRAAQRAALPPPQVGVPILGMVENMAYFEAPVRPTTP